MWPILRLWECAKLLHSSLLLWEDFRIKVRVFYFIYKAHLKAAAGLTKVLNSSQTKQNNSNNKAYNSMNKKNELKAK